MAEFALTAPATEEARAWEGYGTALKPAWEPVIWAMKPLPGTFAENALQHGVSGLNIRGGTIGNSKNVPRSAARDRENVAKGRERGRTTGTGGFDPNIGRWPANVILCHHPDCKGAGTEFTRGFEHATLSWSIESREVEAQCVVGCPVAELDRQSGELRSGFMAAGTQREGIGYGGGLGSTVRHDTHGDAGGASRFFYQAKVSPSERNGSKHPTLKPIDLCRYLASLILPPPRKSEPRRLLVPFAGEGSEIIGALLAGWEEVVGIEREDEHVRAGAERIRAAAPLLFNVEIESAPASAGKENP
jgi:hypothetical protein